MNRYTVKINLTLEDGQQKDLAVAVVAAAPDEAVEKVQKNLSAHLAAARVGNKALSSEVVSATFDVSEEAKDEGRARRGK